MRRPPWLRGAPESRLLRLALLPLDAIALVYAAAAALHRKAYARGVLAPRRLPCRVISVGNLTVGGSGKTPLAAWIAARLHQRGVRVVLASRGYGRAGREAVTVVSDGLQLRCDPEFVGDEPFVLVAHAPGVPVIVGRDRGVAGLRAVAAFDAEVLVLDDGFQHHRLGRDLEIVAVDGALGFGNGCVLPRGPLRESPRALRRADAVFVVDGPTDAATERLLDSEASGARRFGARRRAVGVRPLEGGELRPPESIAGVEVGLLSAIASPESFRALVESLGAKVVAERVFADHHRFRDRDVATLAEPSRLWLTTEKDAVKLLPSWTRGRDVRTLVIDLEIDDAAACADWLAERARASGASDPR